MPRPTIKETGVITLPAAFEQRLLQILQLAAEAASRGLAVEEEIRDSFDVACGRGAANPVVVMDTGGADRTVTVRIKNTGAVTDCPFDVRLLDGGVERARKSLAPGEPTAFVKIPSVDKIIVECGAAPGAASRCKGLYDVKVLG